jgi:hypothetical protein
VVVVSIINNSFLIAVADKWDNDKDRGVMRFLARPMLLLDGGSEVWPRQVGLRANRSQPRR